MPVSMHEYGVVDMVETLASYVPTLIVHHVMYNPEPLTAPLAEEFPATLLFADLSGFTILAEQLAQRGAAGAEELSRILNTTFDELINLVTMLGGDVVTFAGDAMLALWRATDDTPEMLSVMTLRAAQCSLTLQELLRETESRSLHLGELGVRIGISVGTVCFHHVGGIYDRWLWLMTGHAVAEAIHMENLAQPGQVVVSLAAWNVVKHACYGCPVEIAPHHMPTHDGTPTNNAPVTAHNDTHNTTVICDRLPTVCPQCPLTCMLPDMPSAVRLETVVQPAPFYFPKTVALNIMMEPALRTYIPGTVLTRLSAGQGNWLTELRLVTVLFITINELHVSDVTLLTIQSVVSCVQQSIYRYEGSINKLSVDDKGITCIGVFGLPPLSHEDDALRSMQAALAIKESSHNHGYQINIGVTTGQAFCGIVGNQHRREYTILGDSVNLAARLMQAATNTILCDTTTFQHTHQRISFTTQKPIRVKGKAEPVAIYTPHGLLERVIFNDNAIVGRVAERTILASALQAVQRKGGAMQPTHHASLLLLEGDAGIGKTRLVEELHQQAIAMNITTLIGYGDSIEVTTPYFVWRRIFSQALGIDSLASTQEMQEHVYELLAAEPSLYLEASLLNAILPLELPESDVTQELHGQSLAEATRRFLADVLALTYVHHPIVLILENGHWFDSASWSLLVGLIPKMPSLLLVMTMRPFEHTPPAIYTQLLKSPSTTHVCLEPLSLEDTNELICQRLDVSYLPPVIATLIYNKAQGNPSFSEEMAYNLCDTGYIRIENGICRVQHTTQDLALLPLPDTLQGVITSRIDRLQPVEQLALKAASVIGDTFSAPLLYAIYPVATTHPNEIAHVLQQLKTTGLLHTVSGQRTETYQFKQTTTRDIVYHMMPPSQQRMLHRAVAEWYLETHKDHLDEYAPLLAQHFHKANDPRAQQYYALAGNVAFRLFANAEAIAHFTHALHLAIEHHAKKEHLLYLFTRLGRILELETDYERALDHYTTMATIAEQHHDSELHMVALIAKATLYATPNPLFAPSKAEKLLEQALSYAHQLQDQSAIAKIYWVSMLLNEHTNGDPYESIRYGEKSLEIARRYRLREQIAYTLNDISMPYRKSGQTVRSKEVLEESSTLWRKLGNLPMLTDNLARSSVEHYLIGDYHKALALSNEATHISKSINNVAGQVNSRFLVGNIYLEYGQPDKAIELMSDAIFLAEQVGHLAVQIGTRADLAWTYGCLGAVEQAVVLAELACIKSEKHNNLFRAWAHAILARLLILQQHFNEAEAILTKSTHAFMTSGGMLLGTVYVPLAEVELAIALHQYNHALTIVDRLLAYMDAYQILPFKPDALYHKSTILLALNDHEGAMSWLFQAKNVAQQLHSQRMLWKILAMLSLFRGKCGTTYESLHMQQQARTIIQSIAAHTGDADLTESFLALPDVQMIMRTS